MCPGSSVTMTTLLCAADAGAGCIESGAAMTECVSAIARRVPVKTPFTLIFIDIAFKGSSCKFAGTMVKQLASTFNST